MERALEAIGVPLEAVQLAPKFTDLLMMAKDGLPGVLQAMRFARTKYVKQFLKIYDNHPDRLKAILPWEAWCIKGKIPITPLMGEIIFALREHSVNAVKILAITHHPETVMTRIAMAKTPLGYRERQSLDIALGLLPTPRGPTIIGRFYEAGYKPPAEIGPKEESEQTPRNVTPKATATAPPAATAPPSAPEVIPAPPPPVPEEEHDPEEIEIDDVFPDASRTARILSD